MAAGLKRGDIWTVSGGPDDASKPRPSVILQDDAFDATTSVTICPLTSTRVDAPLVRITVAPSTDNGLRAASHLMVDKIATVPRMKLQQRIGRLADADLGALNRAVIVFLGL